LVKVLNPWADDETARVFCPACGTDRESFLLLTAAVKRFQKEFPEDVDAADRLYRELVKMFEKGEK
jgi:hypothetical protein